MKAIVWSKPACPFCVKANIAEGHKIQDLLELVPNARTMPQIWLDGEHLGGYYELEKKLNEV